MEITNWFEKMCLRAKRWIQKIGFLSYAFGNLEWIGVSEIGIGFKCITCPYIIQGKAPKTKVCETVLPLKVFLSFRRRVYLTILSKQLWFRRKTVKWYEDMKIRGTIIFQGCWHHYWLGSKMWIRDLNLTFGWNTYLPPHEAKCGDKHQHCWMKISVSLSPPENAKDNAKDYEDPA